MADQTMKVSVAQWLDGIAAACTDQMTGQFSESELAHLRESHDDRMVYGGYLMGTADAATTMKAELERAHLADRKITVPEPGSSSAEAPGTPDEPTPITVGVLRAFLACRPDLADDLPVVVGGVDFDDPSRERAGLADAVWSDTEGQFGGRLCIAAKGIGLTD